MKLLLNLFLLAPSLLLGFRTGCPLCKNTSSKLIDQLVEECFDETKLSRTHLFYPSSVPDAVIATRYYNIPLHKPCPFNLLSWEMKYLGGYRKTGNNTRLIRCFKKAEGQEEYEKYYWQSHCGCIEIAHKLEEDVNLIYSEKLRTSKIYKNKIQRTINRLKEEDLKSPLFGRAKTFLEEKEEEAKRIRDSLQHYRQEYSKALLAAVKLQVDANTIYLNELTRCINTHGHLWSYYKRGLLYFEQGDYFHSIEDIKSLFNRASPKKLEKIGSEIYLAKGTSLAEIGYYQEAIDSLSKAIEQKPKSKKAHFERALAYFENGNFKESLKDYLTSQTAPSPISFEDTSYLILSRSIITGMSHGLVELMTTFPSAILSSATGLSHGLWALVSDPSGSSKELLNACEALISILNDPSKLEILSALVPETKDFANLSAAKKTEKIGFIIGKYGTEIFAPLGIIKSYSKLRMANKALTLEHMAKNAQNCSKLKRYSSGWKTRHLKAIERYKKAEQSVNPFKKRVLPENSVRKILHQAGFKTFSRPKGLPTNCLTHISDSGGGMVYVKAGTTPEQCILVRVMPGKPHSPNPWQRRPYVVQRRGNRAVLKNNKLINPDLPEAHIPLSEFEFKGW